MPMNKTKKLYKNLQKNIDTIKQMNGNSCDINSRIIHFKKNTVAYMYIESVASDDKVSDFLMRSLSEDVKDEVKLSTNKVYQRLKDTILNSKMRTVEDFDNLFYFLSSGFTVIFIDGNSSAIALETKSVLDRGVTEANDEKNLRGPKDSFTENYMMNLGLIRKRIKDPHLWLNETIVGRRSKTKVAVAYLQDVVPQEKVEKIVNKLKKIDIDGILDCGYILEYLSPKQYTDFPKAVTTERPDLVCGSILDGKIAIIVENSPYVIVLPGLFMDFFQTADDYYQKPSNVTLSRALRFLAFLTTIMTPALYIAVTTFNQEIIPDRLLISIAVQREGVPIPTIFEILILITTFEILRESDIRIPSAMGSSISIVGALVLGDAAVNAGIVSPIVVIVVAMTSISGFLFTDIDFINALRFWRVIFLIASAIMGLVGFVVIGIIFLTKICSLEIMGTPYLTPLSPLNQAILKDGLVRRARNKIKYRPDFFTKKNRRRLGVDQSEI